MTTRTYHFSGPPLLCRRGCPPPRLPSVSCCHRVTSPQAIHNDPPSELRSYVGSPSESGSRYAMRAVSRCLPVLRRATVVLRTSEQPLREDSTDPYLAPVTSRCVRRRSDQLPVKVRRSILTGRESSPVIDQVLSVHFIEIELLIAYDGVDKIPVRVYDNRAWFVLEPASVHADPIDANHIHL